ncbi:MAG: HEAT repeat domain-containing protein [Thermodesulfovibrionales bacterium]
MSPGTKTEAQVLRGSALRRHVNHLSDSDVSKRRAAAEALSEADERGVYPLIKALSDENPGVQDAAMRSLVAIGGEVVAYMVIPLLRENSYLRNTALLILKELGPVSVPLLYPLLKDKDEDVRKFGLDLLGEIKEGVSTDMIMPLFHDPNANVRAAAAGAAAALECVDAVPRLVEALGDEEWVCFSALEALGSMRAEGAVPAITELLGSGYPAIRYAAIETLGRIGSAQSASALLMHASASSGMERAAAIKSLVQIGETPSLSGGLEVLIDLLREGDWEEKQVAIRGLVKLGTEKAVHPLVDLAGSFDASVPGDEEKIFAIKDAIRELGCTEALIRTLEDPSIRFRGRAFAAEMLGEMRCREAVPYLERLLNTYFRDVRRAGMKALRDLSGEGEKDRLLEAVADHDGHIRRMAASALARIGDSAASDSLMKLLREERHMDVLEEAVKALLAVDPEKLYKSLDGLSDTVKEMLGRFGGDAGVLLTLSRDADPGVRTSAVVGLGSLGDQRASDRLREALRDDDPGVRRAAVMSLGNLGCCKEEIKSALSDGDMWVRLYAVKALGRFDGRDVVDALAPMLRDRDLPVVLSTMDVMAEIGGGDAQKALGPMKGHPDPAVREKAAMALESL